MNNKITYRPDDIEQLLLSKTYEELSVSEKEFADTQIESAAEYNEIRATLISIKQIAQEESAVEVSPKVKEDLMQLMEDKVNRVPWYTWNGIAAFLFPSNTPLFKKPGLQFAVMGLLLLLVVNISLTRFGNSNNQLAINTKKENKQVENPDKNKAEATVLIEEIEELVDEPTVDKPEEKESIEEKSEFEPAPAPIIESVQVEDALEVITKEYADEEAITPPVVHKDLAIQEKKIEGATTIQTDIPTTAVSREANYNAVTLSEVNVPESESFNFRKKKISSNSQSLSGNDDVIDLLFVTL